MDQGAFTETGAGALDLSVRPSHFNSLRTEAGIRLGRAFTLRDGKVISPEVFAGFSYELLDTAGSSSAVFTDATAAGTFNAIGVSLDRTAAHLGGKIAVHAQPGLDVFIAAEAHLSGNERVETAGLGLEYQF
jgi:outer membrane autotransporter protein